LQKRVLFTCLLILSAGSLAKEHTHGRSEKLGAVHFATSCNGAAQQEFDRAVALLHSFEFSRAVDGFTAALLVDPKCGVAYWGMALSQWSNPFAMGSKLPPDSLLAQRTLLRGLNV